MAGIGSLDPNVTTKQLSAYSLFNSYSMSPSLSLPPSTPLRSITPLGGGQSPAARGADELCGGVDADASTRAKLPCNRSMLGP